MFQGKAEDLGENGHTLCVSLSFTHNDALEFDIKILDAQLQTFLESESGAIQQACHQVGFAVEVCEHCSCLFPCEHNGEAAGSFCPHELTHVAKLFSHDVFIQKQQGIERLILCGCRDILLQREVGKELRYFLFTHFVRVSHVMKQDEAFSPSLV